MSKLTFAERNIAELKRMVNRTIQGFEGNDSITKDVNQHLSNAYKELCTAYNVAHGWKLKRTKSR